MIRIYAGKTEHRICHQVLPREMAPIRQNPCNYSLHLCLIGNNPTRRLELPNPNHQTPRKSHGSADRIFLRSLDNWNLPGTWVLRFEISALLGSTSAGRFDRVQHWLKNLQPIGTAQPFLTRSIGMRHQPKNVTFPIADSRDVLDRAIRVRRWIQTAIWRRVTQNDLPALI